MSNGTTFNSFKSTFGRVICIQNMARKKLNITDPTFIILKIRLNLKRYKLHCLISQKKNIQMKNRMSFFANKIQVSQEKSFIFSFLFVFLIFYEKYKQKTVNKMKVIIKSFHCLWLLPPCLYFYGSK